MFKTLEKFLADKGLTLESFEAKTKDEQLVLIKEHNKSNEDAYTAIKADVDSKLSKEEVSSMIAELKASTEKENALIIADFREIAVAVKNGQPKALTNEQKGLRAYIEENSEVLAEIKANRGQKNKGFSFTIKATEAANDIGDRDYLGTIDPRIGTKPVRNTTIMDLFPRRSVSGEYFHYWEEDVVTRDAKFVIACATSTHTTKKTWAKRTVELAKIRDIIDICIDMLSDYAFVESSMRKLIDESIKLKADFELLLGASAASTDMLSIDSISSEFNPANALADFSFATGTPFQDANLEQLVDAMGAQISIFGKENAWMANTLVMNFKDFVNYRNLKDSNGNKLVHTLSDAIPTIAGMRVVTSPIVVANTCFVFDSTKGEILDRQAITVVTSFENDTNVEHELVTLVGVERLQFNVRIIDRDAFMKCSDIAVAIAAILKP